MSGEPIRPEDHSVDPWDGPSETASDELAWREMQALIEAVHQTFERDEICQGVYDKALANYEAAEPKRPEDPDYGPPVRSYYTVTDPDTEIDRLARLIVDGEYRRRQHKIQQ